MRSLGSASFRTNRPFVAERVEHIESFGIPLFASPNKIDPCWQIMADVVAFDCLPHTVSKVCEVGRTKDCILVG